MSKDLPIEVVQHILYGKPKDDICRFCYKPDNGTFVNINDIYTIKSEFYKGSTTVKAILKNMLQMEFELVELPHILCGKCSDEVLNIFLFKEKCLKREKYWKKAYNLTAKQITQSLNDIIKEKEFDLLIDKDGDQNSSEDPEQIIEKPVIPRMGIKKCVACPEKFKNTRELYRHWKQFHPKLLPSCHYCGKVFTRAYSLKIHEETHLRGGNKFNCTECNKNFSLERSLREHVKNDHGERNIPCEQCSMRFATKTMLCRHRYLKHKKNKPVQCNKCSETFATNYLLHKHKIKDHKMKVNEYKTSTICDTCGKVLSSHFKLKWHKRSCDKKSNSQFDEEKGSYVCTTCGSLFNKKDSLSKHFNAVHTTKSNPCQVCGKLFKTKVQVRSHMIVHTRERPFRCDECFKSFVSNMALLYHKRLHSGEKPYSCQLCDERFLSASRRMRHMRKKHWGPQLECDLCQNRFHTPYDLKKHQKRHYNPKSKLKCINDCVPVTSASSLV